VISPGSPSKASEFPAPAAAPEGFSTSLVHLYRAEMHRMTVWRQRLDVTSNWAIILTMGITTFALGAHTVPHFVLLLGLAIIAISILMEARRYQHLHHSEWRLHLIDRGFFAPLLRLESPISSLRWREMLAADLVQPRLLISLFCAARVRLRRNYLSLTYFTTAVWITKLYVHPGSPNSFAEFYARLSVGNIIPSWFVAASAVIFLVGSTVLALSCPTIEQLEKWEQPEPGRCSDPFPLP
jgi:uncharacterized membrane protein